MMTQRSPDLLFDLMPQAIQDFRCFFLTMLGSLCKIRCLRKNGNQNFRFVSIDF